MTEDLFTVIVQCEKCGDRDTPTGYGDYSIDKLDGIRHTVGLDILRWAIEHECDPAEVTLPVVEGKGHCSRPSSHNGGCCNCGSKDRSGNCPDSGW